MYCLLQSPTSLAVHVFLVLGGFCATTLAQQTIFNVPSADVLDKGKLYFELDTSYKFNNAEAVGRFSSFVPRLVAGVGEKLEVGLNLIGNLQPGQDSTTLVSSVKWKAYDSNGWVFVVGANIYVPVRNRAYNLGNYSYAQFSKTFETKTRVTLGGYNFTRNVVATNADRAGGQFGFEQPMTDRFSVMADWVTGKHTNGYCTPGFSFKPYSKVTVYLGYSIGNARVSQGNHFFLSEIGINFN